MTQEITDAEIRLHHILAELAKELGRHWNNGTRAAHYVAGISDAITDVVLANRRELLEAHSDF